MKLTQAERRQQIIHERRANQAWMDRAACRGRTDEFFIPDGTTKWEKQLFIANAKAICAECPVQADCLEYALSAREAGAEAWRSSDVWGGKTGAEIRSMRRRLGFDESISRARGLRP